MFFCSITWIIFKKLFITNANINLSDQKKEDIFVICTYICYIHFAFSDYCRVLKGRNIIHSSYETQFPYFQFYRYITSYV